MDNAIVDRHPDTGNSVLKLQVPHWTRILDVSGKVSRAVGLGYVGVDIVLDRALGPLLLRIREHTGCSLLVIEHDMPMISSICDRLVALELGGVIAEGTPEEVLSHPAVIASYLGTDEKAIQRSGTSGSSRSRSRSRAGSRS